MVNALLTAQALGQSSWYDYIRRGILTSGELSKLVQLGITGVTSNPTIFERAIAGSSDYDQPLAELARQGYDPTETFETLALEDIRDAADLLRSVYDHTDGTDGYVSFEMSPYLAHDTQGSITEGRRLFAALDRPNVLVKVPATPEGIPAVRTLIAEGINVNITLIFSLDAYQQVMEAYIGGLDDLASRGEAVKGVASVASFFVSRVDTAVDALLQGRTDAGETGLKGLLGTAAIANARKAYALFQKTFAAQRFVALKAQGAQVQRPLWASTSTKNPAYLDTLYVDSLIGPNTVNTMPPATVEAVLDHGDPKSTLEGSAQKADAALDALARAGVDMDQVTAQLLKEGVEAFAQSYDAVLASVAAKCAKLVAGHAV